MLPEMRGMTLAEMFSMVISHVPEFPNGSGCSFTWLTASMFLLILPAPLMAPLASRSAFWLADQSYSVDQNLEIPTAQAGLYRDYFNIRVKYRARAVLRAAVRPRTGLTVDLLNASPLRLACVRKDLYTQSVACIPVLPPTVLPCPPVFINSLEWIEHASAIITQLGPASR
jgi:hypothetical protein